MQLLLRALSSQQTTYIIHLFVQQIQFSRQPLNLRFGSPIHIEIQFAAQPVLSVLAILAHHDDRRLDRRQHGEKQVQQNKRVRIPSAAAPKYINQRVDRHQSQERNNKGPGPAKIRDRIGNPFA